MLDEKVIIILICIGAAVALSIGIMLVVVIRYSVKRRQQVIDQPVVVKDETSWQKALGGQSNIKEVEFKGSRLIVKLENNELIQKDELHNLGASSVIESEEKVTIVLKNNAEDIAGLLK